MNTLANVVTNLPWNKKMLVLRVANGWTQQEAAERCTTDPKIYYLWENAKSHPREKSKQAIARAFGVKVNEIFSN